MSFNKGPPVLDGKNYFSWIIKIESYMRAQDLWYTVEEEDLPVPGEDATEDKLRYKNHTINKHKAVSLLHDALTESMFTKIANCNTPKKIFDRLKAIHEGGDQIRKIQIRNRISDFEANRMSCKETVQDYYDRTIEIVNEIRALGGELPEEKVVEKAIMSLPNKFEAKLCALEETDKLKQITFLELIGALQASEKRMQIRPPEVEDVHQKTEVLLSAENLDLSNLAISRGASNLQAPSQGGYVQQNLLKKGGNRREIYEPCPHCKKTNHRAQFCFYHPEAICKGCGETGHVERVCIHKNRAKEQANLVELALFDEKYNLEIAFCTEASPDFVEITYSVDETTTQSIKGWILDSGCSHHMCCDRSLLFNFRTQEGRAVRSATGHTTPVLGIGSIYLSRGKTPMIVDDVYYAPGLTQNLLSFGQILRQKIEVLVRGLHLYITDPRNHSVLHAELQPNNFFIFNTHPFQPEISMVFSAESQL